MRRAAPELVLGERPCTRAGGFGRHMRSSQVPVAAHLEAGLAGCACRGLRPWRGRQTIGTVSHGPRRDIRGSPEVGFASSACPYGTDALPAVFERVWWSRCKTACDSRVGGGRDCQPRPPSELEPNDSPERVREVTLDVGASAVGRGPAGRPASGSTRRGRDAVRPRPVIASTAPLVTRNGR